MEDHQGPARTRRLIGAEAAAQPVVDEAGVLRPVVGEFPAEYSGIERLRAGDVADTEFHIIHRRRAHRMLFIGSSVSERTAHNMHNPKTLGSCLLLQRSGRALRRGWRWWSGSGGIAGRALSKQVVRIARRIAERQHKRLV